jgi:hypothetical protein
MLVEKPVLEATVVSKVYNDKKYKDDKIKARILSPEWWAQVAVVSKRLCLAFPASFVWATPTNPPSVCSTPPSSS